jgi:uncharacterized protein (DUF433 family)
LSLERGLGLFAELPNFENICPNGKPFCPTRIASCPVFIRHWEFVFDIRFNPSSIPRLRDHHAPPAGFCRLVVPRAPEYSAGMKLLERITVEPGKCGGRPCIRGMRIRVTDILGMLAEGVSHEEILKDFPYLEPDDIMAALAYAARQSDHAVLQSA